MKSFFEIFGEIDVLTKLVLNLIVWGGMIMTLWRWSFKVNDMVKESKDTACKVSLLEKQILKALNQIQAQARIAEEKSDRRFDRVEGKLNYLFGRTKTTIPPRE